MPPKAKGIRPREKVPTVTSTSSSGLPKWRQSPVNLSKVFTWTKKFPPLLLNGHWSNEGTATMTNNGKTVIIELARGRMPNVRGGPLKNNKYQLSNVQFRWGPDNCRGAEHSVDDLWYSMEAQAMHWNTRYGSIEKCYEKRDGVAVLSYLFQVVGCPGMRDNPILARITDRLFKIKRAGTSTDVAPDCLWWMLDACLVPGYYTYPGSLTTTPYTECVVWIVLPGAIRISARQMDAFRSLYDHKWDNIVRNYRSQHNLHGRRILYATEDAVG